MWRSSPADRIACEALGGCAATAEALLATIWLTFSALEQKLHASMSAAAISGKEIMA